MAGKNVLVLGGNFAGDFGARSQQREPWLEIGRWLLR